MVAEVAGWTLALVLAGAALLKLRDPARSQAALATYGLRGAAVRRGAWIAVVTAELALAIGLGLGSSVAAYLAGALFTSDGCPVCRTLEPAVDYFARDPLVALRTFDEHRDAAAWRALDVPGSPYAVALGLDGTVLAKGTFNSLGQLESVLATAERREREAADA